MLIEYLGDTMPAHAKCPPNVGAGKANLIDPADEAIPLVAAQMLELHFRYWHASVPCVLSRRHKVIFGTPDMRIY